MILLSLTVALFGHVTLVSAIEERCQAHGVKDAPVNLLQVSSNVQTGSRRTAVDAANAEMAYQRFVQDLDKEENEAVPGEDDDTDFFGTVASDGHYAKWQEKKTNANSSSTVYWTVGLLATISIASGMVYAILGLGTALVFHMALRVAAATLTFLPPIGIRQASIYIMCAQPAITGLQAFNLRDVKKNWPFLLSYSASTFIGLGFGMMLLFLAGKNKNATFSCKVLLIFSCFMTLANEAYKRFTAKAAPAPAAAAPAPEVVSSSGGATPPGAEDAPEGAPQKPQDPLKKKTVEAPPIAGGAAEEKPFAVDMSKTSTIVTVVTCGALAGFLQGAIAVGGTFKMMMIVTLNIGNLEWRSTQCLADLPLQFTRLIVVISAGMLNFDTEWPSLIGVISGMGVGVWIGNQLAKHVPQGVFTLIVLAGIGGTSIMMMIKMIEH